MAKNLYMKRVVDGRGKYAMPVRFKSFWEENPDLSRAVLQSVYAALYGTIEGCYLSECGRAGKKGCLGVFWKNRTDQKFCSSSCGAAERMERWRNGIHY